MTSVYKVLNNIQTHLITIGNPFSNEGKDVIVLITGNPGLPDFYTEFAQELHRKTSFSVCIIGQAGHEAVPDKKSNILRSQEHLFNLEGQLKHKLDLINNFIDKNSRLHLIGHSIGAWEIVELLEKDDSVLDRILSINLLFPTLQKMSETKNGIFLNNFVRHINFLVLFLVNLLSFLPSSIIKFLVNMYMKISSIQTNQVVILKFLNPCVVEKVLFLAYDEMDTVNKLNTEAIKRIKHLCNIIYSDRDNWAPLIYLKNLKGIIPQEQIKVVNVYHSFVFDSSQRVAEMVSDTINNKL